MKILLILVCALSAFHLSSRANIHGYGESSVEAVIKTEKGDKKIKLLKFQKRMATNCIDCLFGSEKDYTATGIKPFSQSPTAVELGMNNTPVLDQGQYGTCVTFATTGALDAALGKGDYISQQCALELMKGQGNDWWDGAYTAMDIYSPLAQFGIVSKDKCPRSYADRFTSQTAEEYAIIAEKLEGTTTLYHIPITVDIVKEAIKAKHRVAIGFLLVANSDPVSVQGFNANIAGVPTIGGLWACSQFSSGNYGNFCSSSQAGHEVVITGYDDAQELFKIRNSWNSSVGDAGEFYMTYSFFKSMVMDGTEIW